MEKRNKKNYKSKTANKFSITSMFMILFIVFIAVGMLFVFRENYKSPLKTFYITCENEAFINDTENFNMVIGKEYKFKITTNISIKGNDNKCSVAIVPNNAENTNFTFTSDGTEIEFNTMESLTKGFVLSACDDGFTLIATMDLIEIIELYYPNTTISGCPTAIDSDISYFKMVISSVEQSKIINININLKSE